MDNKSRFLSKVKKTRTCWIWKRSPAQRYGSFFMDKKIMRINRASWIIFKGEIPFGINVLHTCDNNKCVNPRHLYLGTQKENNIDCYLRNRRSQKGSKNGNSKLKEIQVKEIKSLFLLGATRSELADSFKVSISAIQDIVKNRRWNFIEWKEDYQPIIET